MLYFHWVSGSIPSKYSHLGSRLGRRPGSEAGSLILTTNENTRNSVIKKHFICRGGNSVFLPSVSAGKPPGNPWAAGWPLFTMVNRFIDHWYPEKLATKSRKIPHGVLPLFYSDKGFVRVVKFNLHANCSINIIGHQFEMEVLVRNDPKCAWKGLVSQMC